jgi:hypothetical protein
MELHVNFARTTHTTLEGLDPSIIPNKRPRNLGDAKKELNSHQWAAVYNLKYVGFKERRVFKLVRPRAGIKILDKLPRLEYKEEN